MGCETCGDKKPACDKGFTKAALEIKNPSQLVEFRKIVVPASLGDDTAVPPVVGKYCNAILYYEANDQVYLYSSDGIPTKITVDVEALKKQIKDLQDGLANEASTRSAADLEIWQEIEAIEASSDVVDVVGTYAELQQYDTSKLHDKDLIKVLQDETHDDAITYYRWSTSTHAFSYVGAEGPYYTVSETDVLLSGKQDTLIAGTNIQIAADGKTISATDTTYTHFTGATALADGTQGLVPGPLAGDEDKVLKGDGTWGVLPPSAQIVYATVSNSVSDGKEGLREIDAFTGFYRDQAQTNRIKGVDLLEMQKTGGPIVVVSDQALSSGVITEVYDGDEGWVDGSVDLGNGTYLAFSISESTGEVYSGDPARRIDLQRALTAGNNIAITATPFVDHGHNGNQYIISATDTTYTAGLGVDIDAGNEISAAVYATLTLDSPSAGEFFIKKPGALANSSFTELSTAFTTYARALSFRNGSEVYRVYSIDNTDRTIYVQYGDKIYALDYANASDTTGTYTIIDLRGAMTGASVGAAGTKGLVPAPAMGQQNSFLRGDGTWQSITVPVLYTTQGQNEDGAVTQKLFTDTVGNIEAALQILNSGAGVP